MIYLIGPGLKPIPPKGWGAVESVVWDYYTNLKNLDIDAEIINSNNLHFIIDKCNNNPSSIIYIMYDDYITIVPYLKSKYIYYMSHFAYITHPKFTIKYSNYFKNIFLKAIEYKNKIIINAISEEIKQVYIKYGFPKERLNVLHNGAREDQFRFTETPSKGARSAYVAKIRRS